MPSCILVSAEHSSAERCTGLLWPSCGLTVAQCTSVTACRGSQDQRDSHCVTGHAPSFKQMLIGLSCRVLFWNASQLFVPSAPKICVLALVAPEGDRQISMLQCKRWALLRMKRMT